MNIHFTHRQVLAHRLSGLLLLSLLVGCATPKDPTLLEPLREPRTLSEQSPQELDRLRQERDQISSRTRFNRLTSAPKGPSYSRVDSAEVNVPDGSPLQLHVENMPLPAFINEVFGNLLGMDFQIAEDVRADESLLTLRVESPQPPQDLFRLALQVLGDYGVGIQRRGELLRFSLEATGPGDLPLLVSGRALPDVPASHRPVFQFVPLQAVGNANVRSWLQQIFLGQELEVSEDPQRNAIILKGRPMLVRHALSMVQVLDQPLMSGQHSLRIDPVYRKAEALAEDLERLLRAEGYAVSRRPEGSSTAIVLLPIKATNSVVVFSRNAEVLANVRRRAEELDRLSTSPDESRVFRYSVRNTSAESITSVLNQLLGSLETGANSDGAEKSSGRGSGGLVVDPGRNAILFNGSGADWLKLRPMMEEMDNPARLALVEVTIAEVTLTDEYRSGVEWALRNARIGSFGGSLGTEGGLGVGGAGITWLPMSPSGSTRATLNALARSDQVTILSTPRLLVRSGEEASISVGTEIPVVTSEATRPDLGGNTPSLLRNVQLRKTGVLLNILPIIHAGNRIDLAVTQEVSEAIQTDTSGIDSPSILDRSLSTSLSLRDGGAVMLGGLITSNSARGNSRVPLLGRIPILGWLFRSDSRSSDRTELIVMITAYILNDHGEAEAITRNFRERLSAEALRELLPDEQTAEKGE